MNVTANHALQRTATARHGTCYSAPGGFRRSVICPPFYPWGRCRAAPPRSLSLGSLGISSRLVKLTLLFLQLLVFACASLSHAATTKHPPSWYLPERDFDFDAKMLPDGLLFEVPASAVATAQQRLQTSSSVELTPQEISIFTGRRVRPPAGTKPFLVRAMRFTDRTQGFTIYVRRDSSLRTICGAMGSGPARIENYPLVAFLRRAPTQVFPTFSLTQ